MSTLQVATIKSNSSAAPVIQNTSGTEKGQFAKAWVNFNGTGTVAIRDDFNVSSITDNGTGDYTVNYSNSFSNSNYAVVPNANYQFTTSAARLFVGVRAMDTSSVEFHTLGDGGSLLDSELVSVALFGDN
jgi:hypothetical protein